MWLKVFSKHVCTFSVVFTMNLSNFDLNNRSLLQWLMVVSLAVLYNVIFVLGRAVFWELNNSVPWLWWTLDYLCDTIYIADIFVHAHEGN